MNPTIAAPSQPVMAPAAPKAPVPPAPEHQAPATPAPKTTVPPAPEHQAPAAPAPEQHEAEKPAPEQQAPVTFTPTDVIAAKSTYVSDDFMAKLRELATEPYHVALEHDRYKDKPAIGSVLMAIQSEVAEAHAAFTSGKRSDADDVDMLRAFLKAGKDSQFAKYFNLAQKSTFEDELADIILLTLSIAGYYNVDIVSAIELKHKYNMLRTEHSTTTV